MISLYQWRQWFRPGPRGAFRRPTQTRKGTCGHQYPPAAASPPSATEGRSDMAWLWRDKRQPSAPDGATR